jgi:hypothetical protein
MTEITPPTLQAIESSEIKEMVVSLDSSGSSKSSSSVLVTTDESDVDARYARKCNTERIGITTLCDVFDELGTPPSSACTKAAIVSAYMAKSTREHLELGEPMQHLKVAQVLATKLLQFKVFWGNVKLADFLKMVKFDEEGWTSGSFVLRALKNAQRGIRSLGF